VFRVQAAWFHKKHYANHYSRLISIGYADHDAREKHLLPRDAPAIGAIGGVREQKFG
jgi:hypothetical protein